MKELVNIVIHELRFGNENSDMDIIVHDLPTATCDRGQTHQVWANLISNAVKYSQKTTRPIIEIGETEMKG